jgi:hypothetical protein
MRALSALRGGGNNHDMRTDHAAESRAGGSAVRRSVTRNKVALTTTKAVTVPAVADHAMPGVIGPGNANVHRARAAPPGMNGAVSHAWAAGECAWRTHAR